MSELQTWLIVLGVLLILIVVLVNWWQDRRVRRRMQEHFPETSQDALMGLAGTGRREPGLGPITPSNSATENFIDEVDPATEAVIDLSFAQPVDGHALAEPLNNLLSGQTKPVRVFAQTDDGETVQRLRPDERYSSLQLAVLLTNRQGALSDIEWSHLWARAQSIAELFDGLIEGPEQDTVLKQAQALDETCSALDAQVMLYLKPQQALARADVLTVVQEVGFLPWGDQLAWMAETGLPRFTLSLPPQAEQADAPQTVNQVGLLLDLPQTVADQQAFSRMAAVGRDLAARLNAQLLDDQGRPLSDQADELLDQQLYELYQKLEEAGYPAGSERTIRLFS